MTLPEFNRPRVPSALVVEGLASVELDGCEVDIDANAPAVPSRIGDRSDRVRELRAGNLHRNREAEDEERGYDDDKPRP